MYRSSEEPVAEMAERQLQESGCQATLGAVRPPTIGSVLGKALHGEVAVRRMLAGDEWGVDVCSRGPPDDPQCLR